VRVATAVLLLTACDRVFGLSSSPVADDDLVAYYPMDDAVTQLTGCMTDTIGDHDGDCSGNVMSLLQGCRGGTFAFAGSDDAVRISSRGDLDLQALTIVFDVWFDSPPGDTNGGGCPVTRPLASGDQSYAICFDDTTMFLTAAGGSSQPLTIAPTTDQWHQVALTFDGATLTSYFDGTAGPTAAMTALGYDGNPITLGTEVVTTTTTRQFVGRLDELRIYRRALAPQELADVAGCE